MGLYPTAALALPPILRATSPRDWYPWLLASLTLLQGLVRGGRSPVHCPQRSSYSLSTSSARRRLLFISLVGDISGLVLEQGASAALLGATW